MEQGAGSGGERPTAEGRRGEGDRSRLGLAAAWWPALLGPREAAELRPLVGGARWGARWWRARSQLHSVEKRKGKGAREQGNTGLRAKDSRVVWDLNFQFTLTN